VHSPRDTFATPRDSEPISPTSPFEVASSRRNKQAEKEL